MKRMLMILSAHISVDADILEAALHHAWAAGEGVVCVNVKTAMHELERISPAEQQLYRLLEQAAEMGAGDLILEE